MKISEKWLIFLDLDGTLLQDSAKGKIHPENEVWIQKAIKAGHIVCLATGRPWRATEPIYKKLGLNTVVANYNGAQIHNPSDYNFIPYYSYLNLNDVLYILGDEQLTKAKSNLAIEGAGWVQLEKREENLERVFGFDKIEKFKLGINFNKIPLKPTGVVIDTKKGVDIARLLDHLQRTYGDLVEFSSWSKGDGLTPVFDITDIGVTKSKAVSLISRYYNIPIKRTIAMGDGYNDVSMFRTAEISVAMANSSDDVKDAATHSTSKTNKQGGVAEFLEKFMSKDGTELVEELKQVRRTKHKIKEETTAAH